MPNLVHVSPLIFVDFSLANLSFSTNGTSEHTPSLSRPNQYRDLLAMLS